MIDELGVNQPAFAKLAGASTSLVNQWLSGLVKSISAKYAFALQRKTGYNAEWIQTGEGPEQVFLGTREPAATYGEQTDIIRQYREASTTARRLVELVLKIDRAPQSPACSELLTATIKAALAAAAIEPPTVAQSRSA